MDMNGSKISVHNLEKRVVGQRDGTRSGDVRGSKLVKLNIRTPMIRPDRECPVQYFENNLMESISLLAGYQQIQNKSKKIEDELKEGRQFTINYLINELVKRKKDHEVVGRCVDMLKNIRDEYEMVKKRIAEDAIKKMETLRVDQGIQCGTLCSHRGTQYEVRMIDRQIQYAVPVKDGVTEPQMDFKEVAQTHVPLVTQMVQTDKHCVQMDEKCVETEPVKQTLDTVTSMLRRGGGSIVANGKGGSLAETSQRPLNLCFGSADEKVKKRVRFQENDSSQSMSDFVVPSNPTKRLQYNPKPVNMFQNIIPESYLSRESQSSLAGKSGKGVAIPGTPFRGGKCASSKLPKFSGKHLGKEELENIYGSAIVGEVTRHTSGSCSENPQKTQCPTGSSHELQMKSTPNNNSSTFSANSMSKNNSEPFEIPLTPQQRGKAARKPDLNSSFGDYTPYTPDHHRKNQSFLQPKDVHSRLNKEGFFKRVSTVSCKRKKAPKNSTRDKGEEQLKPKGSEKRLKSLTDLLNEEESQADSVSDRNFNLSSSFQIDDPSQDK